MSSFVDLHCHVLPALDDGPTTIEDAVALVRALADLGFGSLHPTPHQTARRWTPTREQREDAAASLRAALGDTPIHLAQPAGENMWDDLLLSRLPDTSFPTYEGGKSFLIEFQRNVLPPRLKETLFGLRVQGMLPVIAHVERWPELADDDMLDDLRGKAALLVNLSTLGGLGGWTLKRRARRLVLDGRAHAVASDAHGLEDVAWSFQGLKWLRRRVGDDGTMRLLHQAPMSLLAGEIP